MTDHVVRAVVDGIIIRVVTDEEDSESAMGKDEAVEFLTEWVRIYEEMRRFERLGPHDAALQ